MCLSHREFPEVFKTPPTFNSSTFQSGDIAKIAQKRVFFVFLSLHCVHPSLGTGSVYGWGNTGVGNDPGTGTCSPATADPNILQETQLRMCTAAESAAQGGGQGLVDGQLCAVGTASSPYRVTWQLIKCIKKIRPRETVEAP